MADGDDDMAFDIEEDLDPADVLEASAEPVCAAF